MSTPNFRNVNASKIYAVRLINEFDYDDLVDNLQAEFQSYVDSFDNDRNYPGRIISDIQATKGKWDITINIIVRSAYYDGVNLDWEVQIRDNRDGDYFEWGEDETPRYVNDYIEAKIKKVEKIFKDYSTPLICRCIFSNGEAVYEKA